MNGKRAKAIKQLVKKAFQKDPTETIYEWYEHPNSLKKTRPQQKLKKDCGRNYYQNVKDGYKHLRINPNAILPKQKVLE